MPDVLVTLRTWRSVLVQPQVAAVFATSAIARLARASVPLAVVLVVADATGSYAWAGAAAAALTFADAGTAPLKGRLADRYGHPRVLMPGALVYAGALVAIGVDAGPHPVWVLGGAVIAGVGHPPISSSVKALLPVLVGNTAHLRVAYVMESTVQQVLFLAGPLCVALAASLASADVALYGAAAALVAGAAGFVLTTRATSGLGRGVARTSHGPGALSVPAVRVLTCATLLQSIIFGANGVAVPASASAFGAPNAAGLVLAAGPIGGLVGGVLIATTGGPGYARYIRLLLVTAACYAPMPLVPFPAIALCMFAGGLVVTPLAAICYQLLSDAVPAQMQTEAFAWLSTAVAAGGGVGAALAGLVVDHIGVHAPLALAMLAPLAAALIGVAAHPRLHRVQASRSSR
ncbi:MAG: hypothetical protein ACRDPQ_02770 [Nocardioidaceae bacterium]